MVLNAFYRWTIQIIEIWERLEPFDPLRGRTRSACFYVISKRLNDSGNDVLFKRIQFDIDESIQYYIQSLIYWIVKNKTESISKLVYKMRCKILIF